jgi:glycine dehydrogenase subunit 1
MHYFQSTKPVREALLSAIHKSSVDELFLSIPEDLRYSQTLKLPKARDEHELKKALVGAFGQSLPYVNFIGAGASAHFFPEWVSQQLLRAEWYTSYTPYQPELAQGTLQAIFEYQSLVASLFGMEVANASMYDGATALVEALLMAVRVTGKRIVIMSSTIHPEYRETVKTYLDFAGINIIEIAFDESGLSNTNALLDALKSNDCAAIALQSPNFFGRIEDLKTISQEAHKRDTLLVGCTTDVSALALIPSFGALGADIAVGDGLSFVGGPNLGGPGVGLFACKKEYLRQMPGRLAGLTTDKEGKTAYVLTLSTREQHIRREKATSNICSNHNLMALAFLMCLSSYGKSGFKALAVTNIKKTLLLRQELNKHNIKLEFLGPHYNETVVKFAHEDILDRALERALKNNFIGGLKLKKFYKNLANYLLISCTELINDEDIVLLAKILGE